MDLDFKKSDGLVTAVIQHHETGRVLMVGYMNEESFRLTLERGYAVFWSRSRGKLWLKGESSGHKLVVKKIECWCTWIRWARAFAMRGMRAVSSGR
jgi:phosphoribosyl-AMP cyclohydrolase